MEGRDGEETERVGRGNPRTVGSYALCNGTSPCSPQIFTEFPETHEMFNRSIFVCVMCTFVSGCVNIHACEYVWVCIYMSV